MNSSRIALLTLIAAALLFIGCSLAPPPELPDPAAEMPADFRESPTTEAYEPVRWWKAFADPVLDRVVESVLESNLDMAAAVARVSQAREKARIAKAAILPVVQGRAGINDLNTPSNAGFGAQIQELGLGELAPGFELPDRLAITTYSLGADFAYETDFWGRARSDALAAGAEYLASESDYQAARIGILAETIGAYFEIVDLRRQLDLTAGMVDVLLEREDVADPVPTGIPTDLLFQRPDLKAAGLRLEAARHNIDARRAELLPTLSFSGSIGLQSSRIDGLFKVDQWFTNLASNLLGPVFQGGRLRSNATLAEIRFNEIAANYGRTVVTAVNEVEAALAVLENEGRRRALLISRRQEAETTVELRSQRYDAGIGGYADFLDSLRTQLNVESALAGAERDLALARLAVHRALGGAWTAPEPLDEQQMTSATTENDEPTE